MAVSNYTPINPDLIKKHNGYSSLTTKEVEPMRTPEELQQEITVGLEHKDLDKEVQPLVSVREEQVEVPPDLQQMGVQAVTTTSPLTPQVRVALSDEEIEKGLHQPITSSFRWLAELMVYILKHAHISLKRIHGHLKRVFVE